MAKFPIELIKLYLVKVQSCDAKIVEIYTYMEALHEVQDIEHFQRWIHELPKH